MFGLFSLIGGIFSGIGGAVKAWFYKRTAEQVIDAVDKNVDRVLPTVKEGITTVGKAAEAAGKIADAAGDVSTAVAAVVKSDNEANVELAKSSDGAGESWLTKNVRPFVFLGSFGLLVGQLFGAVPQDPWPLTICLAYMGARTVDKVGQLLGGVSALKAALTKKK